MPTVGELRKGKIYNLVRIHSPDSRLVGISGKMGRQGMWIAEFGVRNDRRNRECGIRNLVLIPHSELRIPQ